MKALCPNPQGHRGIPGVWSVLCENVEKVFPDFAKERTLDGIRATANLLLHWPAFEHERDQGKATHIRKSFFMLVGVPLGSLCLILGLLLMGLVNGHIPSILRALGFSQVIKGEIFLLPYQCKGLSVSFPGSCWWGVEARSGWLKLGFQSIRPCSIWEEPGPSCPYSSLRKLGLLARVREPHVVSAELMFSASDLPVCTLSPNPVLNHCVQES